MKRLLTQGALLLLLCVLLAASGFADVKAEAVNWGKNASMSRDGVGGHTPARCWRNTSAAISR